MPWGHQLLYEHHHAASRTARAFALSVICFSRFSTRRFSSVFVSEPPPPHPVRGPGPNSEQGEQRQKGEPLVIGDSAAEATRKEDITQMKQEWEAMRAEKTAPVLATLSREHRVRAGCCCGVSPIYRMSE